MYKLIITLCWQKSRNYHDVYYFSLSFDCHFSAPYPVTSFFLLRFFARLVFSAFIFSFSRRSSPCSSYRGKRLPLSDFYLGETFVISSKRANRSEADGGQTQLLSRKEEKRDDPRRGTKKIAPKPLE